MKLIIELPNPPIENKTKLAKKLGISLNGVYRTLKGDYRATDKFLKAVWGKEKYNMWITHLQTWR